ncbi:MAG: TrkH family potassium uptake protein [Clostridia bacterium]|nr:TrkH family potassium uptake protein [Clostridia bacterium]
MNISKSLNILGKIMLITGALFMLPVIVAFIYKENTYTAFLVPMSIMLLSGLAFTKIKSDGKPLYIADGFVIVTFSWILMSIFGGLPFVLTGAMDFVDAIFETVSGFTTTGSTILKEVESLPKSILFWRSFTHWVGGMGVLVFVLAISSKKDEKNMFIMKAESPGPKAGKLVASTKKTARILYLIYLFLTVLEVVFLLFGKMPLFDAITTAFATAGTGGFGVRNANIAAYNSKYVEYVVAIFMMLFATNFSVYFLILIGKIKDAFASEEIKWYFGIIATATLLIGLIILPVYKNIEETFRNSFFTVTSTMSTTGFITDDFELWPTAAKAVIFLLMFVGGCAGSTGGGLKVVRIMILGKFAKSAFKLSAHPRALATVTVDKKKVDDDMLKGVVGYFVTFIVIYALSIFVISLDNVTITEAIGGVTTCMNNVGPAFERLGATGNFSHLSDFSKLFLSLDMLLGRLEIFPVLALLSPSIWKK